MGLMGELSNRELSVPSVYVQLQAVTLLLFAMARWRFQCFAFRLQALVLNPKAALPLLGLAQINLLQNENTNAITLLEKALQYAPGWSDALMARSSEALPAIKRMSESSDVAGFSTATAYRTCLWLMLNTLLCCANACFPQSHLIPRSGHVNTNASV